MGNKETAGRLLSVIIRHKACLAGSLLFAAIWVVLSLYAPILIGRCVDLIVGPGSVDFASLLALMGRLAAAYALAAAAQWLMNACNNRIAFHAVRDIRERAFARLQKVPIRYMDDNAHGDILSRVVADVDQLSDGLLMGFSQLFTGILTIFGTFGFMASIHGWIALAVALLTPISLFIARFISRRTYAMFSLQSKTRGSLTALLNEMIEGQKVVQAFGYEEEAIARFDEINGRLGRESLEAVFFSSITNPCTRFVNGLVYAVVGVAGAFGAMRGALTVGQLTSFLSYASQYAKPFNEISGVLTELQGAFACAARVFALIDEPEEDEAGEGAAPCAHEEAKMPGLEEDISRKEAKMFGLEEDISRKDGVGDASGQKGGGGRGARSLSGVPKASPEEGTGQVELRDVSFSYRPDRKLIEGLCLSARPGQRTAIVGPTGCGKTTLINLLMRFYDADRGEILVDGQDVRSISRDSLRKKYGMVLQDTWLKAGTVAENIAYGRPDATREEIVEAAKAAYAHGFVKRLPDGYDTFLSEDGGSLSQGQKQLLCIARVMLCRPPMLILDEATSSIDAMTEIRVQDAFAKMMEGRTSFVVAHRLSTIREADVILVMRDGAVVEQGTHEELLCRGGFYASLYRSQFEGEGI